MPSAVNCRRATLQTYDESSALCQNLLIAGTLVRTASHFKISLDISNISTAEDSIEVSEYDAFELRSSESAMALKRFLKSLSAIAEVDYRRYEHPIASLCNLAIAEIIVVTESQLSYVAAISGISKIVVSWGGSRPMLPSWVPSNFYTGEFEKEGFYKLMENGGVK